ncbi:MAG: hypothetical protein HYS89_00005, partial [Candidatus Colwellbacteria bacterium]|nr:hypothetical protein [Candidatus Colwellbacteria bacterium]
WITAALVGLLILFGSFLILKTLNPKLTNLEDIVLKINPEVEITLTTGDPQAVCSTHTECALACASFDCYPGGSCDTSSIEPWPGIAQFGDTVAVSDLNIPGVSAAGARILPGLKAPLEAAGSIAIGRGDGLYITGGWRSLTTQFLFACADLGRVPTYVAWPGSSNHGQGIAVDISLTGGPAHGSATYCRELAEIMYAAGWTRYTKEFWHFEYYADPAQRNTGNRSTSVYDCAGG